MRGQPRIRYGLWVFVAGSMFGMVGCASLDRLPNVELSAVHRTTLLGIPDARFYPDRNSAAMEALAVKVYERQLKFLGKSRTAASLPPASFLVISGGGDNGAFGAGLLAGWTEHGDRPQFNLVTGISTGALTAPFAYLGSDYDAKLKELYTEIDAKDVFIKRNVFAAVADDAMTDTTPLKEMIDRYLDQSMVDQIARKYAKGRLLFVATTNLDQGRPVLWNIGAIAESGRPEARDLIAKILRASAAIPGLFPPVMFNVEIDGKQYQEMHVDGGAVAQAFLYPSSLKLRLLDRKAKIARKRTAYIIRNGRPFNDEENVKRQTLSIAMQAVSVMTTSSGVNDTYRIYLTTRRDGVDFNLAFIGDDFTVPYKEPFDRTYMQALFEYGRQKGLVGYPWRKRPFGYSD